MVQGKARQGKVHDANLGVIQEVDHQDAIFLLMQLIPNMPNKTGQSKKKIRYRRYHYTLIVKIHVHCTGNELSDYVETLRRS